NKQQRKKFWKEPTQLWEEMDLRKLSVILDGNFIAELEDIAPAPTAVVIGPGAMEKFRDPEPEVRAAIIGRYLAGATITLLNEELTGLSLSLAGTPTDKRIEFIIHSSQPVPAETVLEFGIVKGEFLREAEIRVRYQPRE
ncbi:hypothetical protein MYX77_12880, partial [Acidobacteriia bacterium AH_259_A11_L15]|nr:hypothetical protein [Acidobacteriia bacterium AH_259_A11_L15]